MENKMNKILNYCLPALALVCVQAQAAPILQVQDGILTGAKYVDVAGAYYDVEFLDGTCIEIFDGCFPPIADAFEFVTQPSALIASWALLDQVFVDGPAGAFDTVAARTRGCTSDRMCMVITPYYLIQGGAPGPFGRGQSVLGTFAVNYSLRDTFWDFPYEAYVVGADVTDHALNDWITWARWTPSAGQPPVENNVPEPGMLALLSIGLLGPFVGRQKLQG